LRRNIVNETLRPPEYRFDDGRTNKFLYDNTVRSPNIRPNIDQLVDGWISKVVGRPLTQTVAGNVQGNVVLRQQLAPVLGVPRTF